MRIRVLRNWDFTKWHPWFAWYPVLTEEGVLVWLETVYRRWSGYIPIRGFVYTIEPK